MPYMYSEMQNKLSKTRESPLEPMGQIISSRCPKTKSINKRKFKLQCLKILEQDRENDRIVLKTILTYRSIFPPI